MNRTEQLTVHVGSCPITKAAQCIDRAKEIGVQLISLYNACQGYIGFDFQTQAGREEFTAYVKAKHENAIVCELPEMALIVI